MYYSYVMGVDNSINELKNDGFIIEADGNNFTVTFPKDKVAVWEKYIENHLQIGFWNDYLADNSVIFLFHLQSGIKRYVVKNYENEEVIALCEKLCECKFESIKSMLSGNNFYKDKIK